MQMKKVGIVSINYNSEDLLEKLIKDLIGQSFIYWDLVVVNNQIENQRLRSMAAAFDDERIKILEGKKNLGYARANNLGFEYLTGHNLINGPDIVLFINPDISIGNQKWLEQAISSMQKLGADFLGPEIINNDNSIMAPHLNQLNYLKLLLHIGNNGVMDKLCGINRRFKNLASPIEVFLINGSCLGAKAGAFAETGMFDPNTFLYYEEECLFRKAKEKQKTVFYDPRLKVRHVHSGTVSKSLNYLGKKKLVYQSEIYLLKNVLKCNKIKVQLFKLERWLELAIGKLLFSKKNGQ